jgi:DNA-binding CsgD family transcriptional regulator
LEAWDVRNTDNLIRDLAQCVNRQLLPQSDGVAVAADRHRIWQRLKSLTSREVDVLCYVLGGQLNKEIAAELGIGEKTIKVHRGHIMEKLGVGVHQVVNYSQWCCVWYWPKDETRMTNLVGQLLTALLASGMLLT